MFGTSLALCAVGTVILYFLIKRFNWEPKINKDVSKRSLFNFKHVKEAIMVTFRRRKGPNRMFALLVITIFLFQMAPMFGEITISYLYVQKRYGWEVAEYSKYGTVTAITSLIGQAVLIPLLNLLKIRESTILLFVLLSTLTRHIIKGFAAYGWMYYLAAMVDIIGGYASSMTRAMLALCIPQEELGKIFSFLAFIDGILPFAVAELYAKMWILTEDSSVPGTVFFVSAGSTAIAVLLTITINILLKGRKMTDLTQYFETKDQKETQNENIIPGYGVTVSGFSSL